MLSKSDKQWLIKEIKKAVEESLTVEIHMEKVRDENTGQPLKHTEIIKEKVYIPSFICQILPYHEGALRGMQEDISKNNNSIGNMSNQIETIGNILIQTEDSLKALASISDRIKSLTNEKFKQVEYIEGQINESDSE